MSPKKPRNIALALLLGAALLFSPSVAWAQSPSTGVVEIDLRDVESVFAWEERNGYSIWREVPISPIERHVQTQICINFFIKRYQILMDVRFLGVGKKEGENFQQICAPAEPPPAVVAEAICRDGGLVLVRQEGFRLWCAPKEGEGA